MHPWMAEKPDETLSAAGGWRPCRGRRVWSVDRTKAAREPADRQRALEDSGAGGFFALQTHQAVDVL